MLQRVRRKQARARRRSDAMEMQVRLERNRTDIVSGGSEISMDRHDKPITTAATESQVSDLDRSPSSPHHMRPAPPQPASKISGSAGFDLGLGSTLHSDNIVDRGSTEDEERSIKDHPEPEPEPKKDVVDRGAI